MLFISSVFMYVNPTEKVCGRVIFVNDAYPTNAIFILEVPDSDRSNHKHTNDSLRLARRGLFFFFFHKERGTLKNKHSAGFCMKIANVLSARFESSHSSCPRHSMSDPSTFGLNRRFFLMLYFQGSHCTNPIVSLLIHIA